MSHHSSEQRVDSPFELKGLAIQVPEPWPPIYEWAAKSNVLSELFFLIDATLLAEAPTLLGNILALISTPIAARLLEESEATGTPVKILSRLSQAYRSTTAFPKEFRPFQLGPTVVKQLSGNADRLYLAAVTLARAPSGSPKFQDWMVKLQTWLLAHGLQRAATGNFQDRNLSQTARDIRLCCEDNPIRRRLFVELYTPTHEIEVIDRWLQSKTQELLQAKPSDHETSSLEKNVLRSLLNVSKYEPSPIAHPNLPPSFGTLLNIPQDSFALPTYESYVSAVSTIDEDGLPPAERRMDDEDGDLDIAEVVVSPAASYTHQRLTANSVLLLNAEELQYLPHSWQKPNPIEADHLIDWIDRALDSANAEERFNGAVSWISIRTGYSFRRALDIEINNAVGEGWGLDTGLHKLRRLPPRRKSGWVPKTQSEIAWVTSIADEISIELDSRIQAILEAQLANAEKPDTVGGLWNPNWATSAESAFTKRMTGPLGRITPGMLGAVYPQRLYSQTGDAAFARLLGSHPKAGLPGACAYAAWTVEEVAKALGSTPIPDTSNASIDPHQSNALGSRLDPLEDLLVEAIAQATMRLEEIRNSGDPIRFHNAYTAYWVVALLAATGARPIRDPFEAREYFDFDEAFVFVDDKASGDLRKGRLVPLPRSLCRQFSEIYPKHLAAIAEATALPPHIAEKIRKLADGEAVSALPYFFLLAEEPERPWISVAETSINELGLFDWPLPLNLFRHRLSIQMRRWGADPEIIDAIEGHAESGCATHGDDSTRIWAKDMAAVRPILESIFSALQFQPIRGWSNTFLSSVDQTNDKSSSITASLFGRRAREAKRKLRVISAIRDAKLQVTLYLNGRTLTELSSDEIYALSKSLLLSPNGLPRPTGYLRYQWLMRKLERAYQKTGRKLHIKKRFVRLSEFSPFNEEAPGAHAIFSETQRLIHPLTQEYQPSRLPLKVCATYSSLLLITENRITDLALLGDILAVKNFRLVHFRRRYYLEYAKNLQADNPLAVARRFSISPYLASLLDRLLSSRHQMDVADAPTPEIFQFLSNKLAAMKREKRPETSRELIRLLCKTIDQFNAMTLPGVVAGYLGGRVRSVSLQWSDWLRLEHGKAVTVASVSTDESQGSGELAIHEGTLPSGPTLVSQSDWDEEISQHNTKEFFDDLHDCLTPFKATLSTDVTENNRRDILRSMSKVLRDHRDKVSSASYLLGQWLASLVSRKRNQKSYLALNSIERYLSALLPAFQEVAHSVDLFDLDDEGMSDFYTEVLECRSLERPGYVCGRLLDFHRWARRQGIEDPDWDDVPLVEDGDAISPSFIAEAEYINALNHLTHLHSASARYRTALAFILILCYRFGLRASEALGLRRCDWMEQNGRIVVLVRKNRLRKLKTTTYSRRQVPLVFTLTKLEQSIIHRWQQDAEALHGDDLNCPLFCSDESRTDVFHPGKSKQILREVLKLVTGNPETTLHDTRHSAANRIATALFGIPTSIWKKAGKADDPTFIRNTLLGRESETRRDIWAMRRFIGHGATNTLIKNYVHLVGNWADELTTETRPKSPVRHLANAIDLETLPVMEKVDHTLMEKLPVPTQKLSLLLALRAIRLMGRGKGVADIADTLSVSNAELQRLNSLLIEVSKKSKPSGSKPEEKPIEDMSDASIYMRRFIARISETAWQRLTSQLLKLEANAESVSDASKGSLTGTVVENQVPIQDMIGRQRQLLMWEEAHFEFIRHFLSTLNISDSTYTVFRTSKADNSLLATAARYGFSPTAKHLQENKKAFQLDSAREGKNRNLVERRCALVFLENTEFWIRNSIELTILLMAYYLTAIST